MADKPIRANHVVNAFLLQGRLYDKPPKGVPKNYVDGARDALKGIEARAQELANSDPSPSREEELDLTLAGVMHSVDKWLDGNDLVEHLVVRAATAREKVLKIIEELEQENARLTERLNLCRETLSQSLDKVVLQEAEIAHLTERLTEADRLLRKVYCGVIRDCNTYCRFCRAETGGFNAPDIIHHQHCPYQAFLASLDEGKEGREIERRNVRYLDTITWLEEEKGGQSDG